MTWTLFIPELYFALTAAAFFGLSLTAQPNLRRTTWRPFFWRLADWW